MTPEDEAHFITLWQQGMDTAAIAAALGIPAGTARSRAYTLQQQGRSSLAPGEARGLTVRGRHDRRADQDQCRASTPEQCTVQTPVQIMALPSYPKGKAVRWNLWILDAIRDDIAALAAQRGVSPSQLVQELLWKALSDRRASML
jgi:hypothetical protein